MIHEIHESLAALCTAAAAQSTAPHIILDCLKHLLDLWSRCAPPSSVCLEEKNSFKIANVNKITKKKLRTLYRRTCDVLLSDVSPNRSGNKSLDDAAISDYCTQSLELASRCLKPGGTFVCKLLQGAELQHTLERAKPLFKTSGGLMKPAASRPKSREIYLVAKGFDAEAYSNRLFW